MKIELLGALDYNKLKKLLEKLELNSEEIIEEIKQLEKEGRVNKVATSGRLSRFKGSVFEILEQIENRDYEKNVNFIKRVTSMGHNSITDHDYVVFAIKDVSPVIEQTIIEERFSSFTVKSRREVDFSNVGFYTPDFHDKDGNILENNEEIKKEYNSYMKSLFKWYSYLVDNGMSMEDSRFVLPYSYNSNIIMGVDAHTLRDLIIKLTKTKYANIGELKELGETLYKIAKENIPYIIDEIDEVEEQKTDAVDDMLSKVIDDKEYKILDKVKLLSHTENPDDVILISAIMRRYQFDKEKAGKVYKKLCEENPNFKTELMKKIAFESDKLELTQANFEFQIPLSFAVLTHLTRHRTHDIMVPDFVPNVDLTQYKIPPKIKNSDCLETFENIFKNNEKVYKHFKEDYGIREEDLVYFTLSGNMVNVVTNMNGKALEHILGLRECTKAQWETRQMSYDMHKEIDKVPNSKIFSSILGAKCETVGYCPEGKESCGKIYKLQKQNQE